MRVTWPWRNKSNPKNKQEGIPISLWSYITGGDEAVRQMRIGLGLPPDRPPRTTQPTTRAGITTANTTANTRPKRNVKPAKQSSHTMGAAPSRSQRAPKKQQQHAHNLSSPTACKTCGHASAFPAPAAAPTLASKSPPTLGTSTFPALGTAAPAFASTSASAADAGLSEQDKKLIEVKTASPGIKWPDVASAMGLGPKDIQGLIKRWRDVQASGAVEAAQTGAGAGANATTTTTAQAGRAFGAPTSLTPTTTFDSGGYGAPTGWGAPKPRGSVGTAQGQQQTEQATGFGFGGLGAYGQPTLKDITTAPRSDSGQQQQQQQSQTQQTQPVDGAGRRVKILDGEGIFTLDELEMIWKIIMKDEQGRWLRISSKFADKSGVVLHPDDIKEAFGEED